MGLSGQEYVDLYAADIKDGRSDGIAKPSARIPAAAAG